MVTVFHLNKTKNWFEVYTVQDASGSGVCALRLNAVSILHVEKEPNAMTEAWEVDQSLISKLKEQYRKERKGKKGVKSKCGQTSAASCLIRHWSGNISLVWAAPFRSSSLPPSLCFWHLRFTLSSFPCVCAVWETAFLIGFLCRFHFLFSSAYAIELSFSLSLTCFHEFVLYLFLNLFLTSTLLQVKFLISFFPSFNHSFIFPLFSSCPPPIFPLLFTVFYIFYLSFFISFLLSFCLSFFSHFHFFPLFFQEPLLYRFILVSFYVWLLFFNFFFFFCHCLSFLFPMWHCSFCTSLFVFFLMWV